MDLNNYKIKAKTVINNVKNSFSEPASRNTIKGMQEKLDYMQKVLTKSDDELKKFGNSFIETNNVSEPEIEKTSI